jgi:double-stranded uracil-DNA glycosylase
VASARHSRSRAPEPAEIRGLPDLIAPGLEILFVGINPGLESARVGHYHAGPGNLFWRCLHESGLVPVRLRPEEDRQLLEYGIGITDCVARPSRSATEVTRDEFRLAAPLLLGTLEHLRPRIVCFNGLTGYRGCFDPRAALGLQPEPLGGARAFVVPSTSAANAGYTREERIEWFTRLREFRDALLVTERR